MALEAMLFENGKDGMLEFRCGFRAGWPWPCRPVSVETSRVKKIAVSSFGAVLRLALEPILELIQERFLLRDILRGHRDYMIGIGSAIPQHEITRADLADPI